MLVIDPRNIRNAYENRETGKEEYISKLYYYQKLKLNLKAACVCVCGWLHMYVRLSVKNACTAHWFKF